MHNSRSRSPKKPCSDSRQSHGLLQPTLGAASSAGDEIQSVGVTDDELSTAIITVKGIYNNFIIIMDN